jgi:predicted phosphodiesterase
MKYAIISDIHSNVHALRKVLKEIEPLVDKIVCLGDIVGYNASPKECIKIVKNHPKMEVIVHGNHDIDSANYDKLGFGHIMHLSRDAASGIHYSFKQLNLKEKEWLKSFPQECLVEDKEMSFWVSHYSPEKCTSYGYILCVEDSSKALKVFKEWGGGSNIFFFGHSHIPAFIEERKGKIKFNMDKNVVDKTYKLRDDSYYLINPGAVGQPRDDVTSYAILDTKEKTLKIKSFKYNIEAAQRAVRKAGYSSRIANRLDPDHNKKLKRAKKERCKRRQKQRDSLKKK